MSDQDNRSQLAIRRALTEIRELRQALQDSESERTEPIAIVGMACRMPGAEDAAEFWELMRSGTDAVSEVPSSRWDVDAFYDPNVGVSGKSYTRQGAFLDGVDQFDAPFFGISPREAANMDPQQRLFLEVGWEALENAGQPIDKLNGTQTGVFLGVTGIDYNQMLTQRLPVSNLDPYVLTGTTSIFAAGRLSFRLGLQGPSLSLDTACSSSLVATHLACQSLRSGDCTMALAGGVNLMLAPENFVILSQATMLSPDGRCKTFDSSADGYGRGEGCGVVVLKRLSTALADHDRVLAVIRGTAVNQDGRSSGITVPNGQAQQAVIRQALTDAGVAGPQVSYVEAHGTGTALGDPIEMSALTAVLGPGRDPAAPVTVGSVKTNIGHLEAAAGVAGLIKTVLALRHEQLPPLLHLKEVNPSIDIEGLPVRLPTALTPWPRQAEPRVAGVSSFGASGTNAHLIVEEAPAVERTRSAMERPVHVLSLSARGGEALKALASKYVRHLAKDSSPVADIAFTANTGRAHFSDRLAVVAGTIEELRERLEGYVAGTAGPDLTTGTTKPGGRLKIAFLFTGQGSQYAGMARELYETEPGFRADLDHCDQLVRDRLGHGLLSVIFGSDGAGSLIDQTRYTQPALFALQYALARLWLSWGIKPAAMLGHSVGEYAAACVAGVFSVQDGLALVVERARLMDELPAGGAMATVYASVDRVASAIAPYQADLAIAAINGPEHVVVSGVRDSLEKVVRQFTADGVKTKNLPVSHAFHSPLLDPMLDAFEKRAAEVGYETPAVPLISNLTGDMVGPSTINAAYLREHARQPVRFIDGLQRLADRGIQAFIEIGPAPHLCGIAKNTLPGGGHRMLPSLRKGQSDWTTLLRSVGELYTSGLNVDWASFDKRYSRYRVELPTYAFDRKRYWFTVPDDVQVSDGPVSALPERASAPTTTEESRDLLGTRVSSPLDLVQFQALLTTDVHPSLADCVSGETTVVNAGFYLETVVQAAEKLHGSDAVRIEGLVIPQALVLPADGRLTTQLVIAEAGERATFSYHSKTQKDAEDWALHAQGRFSVAQPDSGKTDRAEIDAIIARCETEITGVAFYGSLWRRKLHLGPSAQWLSRIARRDDEAIAWMRATDPAEQASGYRMHPGIVDSALQAVFPCLPQNLAANIVIMLLEIEDYSFYGHDGGPLLCHVALRERNADSSTETADIVLMTEQGRHVARMTGVHMKVVDHETLLRAIHTVPRAKTRALTATTATQSGLAASLTELVRQGQESSARDRVRAVLIDQVATALGTARDDISPEVVLQDFGMDSLLAVEIRDTASTALGIPLPAAWFLDTPSVASLENRVIDSIRSSTPATTEPRGVERTGPGGMHIVEYGTGEPIVFVHGGAFGGVDAWQTQLPLAERWRLIFVSRLNYGASATSDREDFAEDGRLLAEVLEGGTHIVAHSYGTLGAMDAALRRPDVVRSLTLIESAASSVARGKPAVDDYERAMRDLLASPPDDPDEFFRALFAILEPTANYPSPLPEALRSFARRAYRGVRWPWEAEIPVQDLRAAKFSKLVVSGGQRPLFEEISDALAHQLGGRRLIVPGGHGTQNAGAPFNRELENFLNQAKVAD